MIPGLGAEPRPRGCSGLGAWATAGRAQLRRCSAAGSSLALENERKDVGLQGGGGGQGYLRSAGAHPAPQQTLLGGGAQTRPVIDIFTPPPPRLPQRPAMRWLWPLGISLAMALAAGPERAPQGVRLQQGGHQPAAQEQLDRSSPISACQPLDKYLSAS